MRHIGLAFAALAVAGPTWASDAPQTAPAPATLAGHAALPAATTIAPPADAPADARLSGKFTGPTRVETPGARPGDTGPLHGARPTGVGLALVGQPIQGFSGFAMNRAPDGSLYVLSDNGFGAKRNSADALLAFHRVAPD